MRWLVQVWYRFPRERRLAASRTAGLARVLVALACGSVALLPPARALPRIGSDSMILEHDGAAHFTARTVPEAPLLRACSLTLFDGRGKTACELGVPVVRAGAGVLRASYPAAEPLQVTAELRPQDRCLVWDVTVRNAGAEQAWLEVGPRLELQAGPGMRFFDGWEEHDVSGDSIQGERLRGGMPLAIAWNPTISVAVGLEPSELVSYFRTACMPASGGRVALDFVVRIVVDPGESEQVRFISAAAPGEWGKYEIFEAYYDSFPAWFRPRPDVDPRASLGSSQYRAWPARADSPEICRRLYGGWEWCYAPFRRTGDLVGREALWEYAPARPFGTNRGQGLEAFRRWRREAFTAGARDCNVAMMFYIPSQIWCEETLAQEHYADALTTDPKQKTYFDTPWVTGHDNEVRVFPYGTSFEQRSHDDMREIAEHLDVSGFAFDTAGGTARYTGPALPTLKHRAWDEDVGVYCSELVAIARLMDFVHTLRRNGYTLAVVSNPMPTGSYASCFHSDSAMIERNPWKHGRHEAEPLRWRMGQKTLVWWEGYEVTDFVDRESISADNLADVYEGLADFTLLQSLRLGYIPTPNFTQGVARLVRWLPAISECVLTGWQPVPAVRVPEPLWSSRYGRGLQTIVVVAHETGEPVQAAAQVAAVRLGQGAWLFAGYEGAAMDNRLVDGDTEIDLHVPVRVPVLLRAELAVSPAAALDSALVARQSDPCASTLTARLRGRGRAEIRLRVPSGMTLESLRFAAAPVAFTIRDGDASTHVDLADGSLLEARFVSAHLRVSAQALSAFPFVEAGQPACTLRLEPGSSARLRRAAWRIQEYVRYWHKRAVVPALDVVLPLAEGAAAAGERSVWCRLRVGSSPTVTQVGGDLIIEAGSETALENLVLELLRALDHTYWTAERFGTVAVRERLAELP